MIFTARLSLIFFLVLLLLSGCKHNSSKSGAIINEPGVIIAEKAQVRNSTALVAAPLKELKRGDTVNILEKRSVNQREFLRVRVEGDKPVEGWLESRQVISKKIVDECNKLAEEWKDVP